MSIYIIEVVYHKEAPFLADQEVEEQLSEVVMCLRLTENGIRDGVDGGEECFDIFLVETEALLPRIEEALWKLKRRGILKEWYVYETDWKTIKSHAKKLY